MSPTVTGVFGIDEGVLKEAASHTITHQTTTATYQGTEFLALGTWSIEQAPATVTDVIIANPDLLASLERAIESLEPGKLLTDKDVFGDGEGRNSQ